MQAPSACRIVLFCTRLQSLKFGFSTSEVAKHPAIITHVWDNDKVNLQVFPDGSNPFFKSAVTNDSSKESYWEWSNKTQNVQDAEFRGIR